MSILSQDEYQCRVLYYFSSFALFFKGNWNTSEAYGIQHHIGKQSTYTQFPVPHSESTIRCLSLVIRVSPNFISLECYFGVFVACVTLISYKASNGLVLMTYYTIVIDVKSELCRRGLHCLQKTW